MRFRTDPESASIQTGHCPSTSHWLAIRHQLVVLRRKLSYVLFVRTLLVCSVDFGILLFLVDLLLNLFLGVSFWATEVLI